MNERLLYSSAEFCDTRKFVKTGEYRQPFKDEFYLSGAIPLVRQAPGNFCVGDNFYIMIEQNTEQLLKVAEENVARGAALLDKDCPTWFEKVNFSYFNVQSCRNCVLGQVYGFWSSGMNALGLNCGCAIENGFCGIDGLDDEMITPIWQAAAKRSRAAYFGLESEVKTDTILP